MKSASYSWITALPFWRLLDDLRVRFTSRWRTPYENPRGIPGPFESAEKSKLDAGRTNVRTYGRTDRLVNPLLPVTATVLAFLPGQQLHTQWYTIARNACTRVHKQGVRWNDGFVAAPPTEDIGVLSYSFHHNNSPAYKYRRTVCTEVGYVGTERYLGSTSRSPSLRPLPSFSHPPSHPLAPPSFSSPLVALLLLAFPRPWTAVKQSRSAPPPLTIRIKPFNCRIVFDGSFSPAKLLFKLVPGYVRTSGDRLLPPVSPCSITFTRNVLLVLTILSLFFLYRLPLTCRLWQSLGKNGTVPNESRSFDMTGKKGKTDQIQNVV